MVCREFKTKPAESRPSGLEETTTALKRESTPTADIDKAQRELGPWSSAGPQREERIYTPASPIPLLGGAVAREAAAQASGAASADSATRDLINDAAKRDKELGRQVLPEAREDRDRSGPRRN